MWKKEKQIQKVKTEKKISYPDALKIVQETNSWLLPGTKPLFASNAKCDHPLLVDLFNLYFILCDNKDIVFAWVPGHVGIRGNNVLDLAAKHALEKSISRRMAFLTLILRC